VPICTQIVNSIVKYWKLAGGKADNTSSWTTPSTSTPPSRTRTRSSPGDRACSSSTGGREIEHHDREKGQGQGRVILGLDVTVQGFPFMAATTGRTASSSASSPSRRSRSSSRDQERGQGLLLLEPGFRRGRILQDVGREKGHGRRVRIQGGLPRGPSIAVQVEVGADYQSPWMDILAKYRMTRKSSCSRPSRPRLPVSTRRRRSSKVGRAEHAGLLPRRRRPRQAPDPLRHHGWNGRVGA